MKKEKGGGGERSGNGLLPNSLRIISSCLKTVSHNATTVATTVRSAGASVAASISVAAAAEDHRDQVLWAGFDKLDLGPSVSRQVLLLGYANGFQVLDVEDASDVSELVSKRDGPVTFLQLQPTPEKSEGHEDQDGFKASQPLLLVVAGDESVSSNGGHVGGHVRDNLVENRLGNSVSSPTAVRFYSLESHNYVHVLRFRSAVYMVRCSPRIVAVGLSAQIYCFDAVTLENKFSVVTYPVPQPGQGMSGVNTGYGPMAVGPRWIAYASNGPLLSNMGRLSPQNLTPSPGVSPSTSPSNGSLVARYAMESSKQLAAGIINLGDMGYKTLSKYCQELLPDGSNSPVSSSSGWKVGRLGSSVHSMETDNAGIVVVKDFVSRAVISQFRAHTSPLSALCFDPSGTLLVTASVHGNNINIFRIMPSYVQNGTGTGNYDWSSSHVHLYKLYRGITTAVIQDICFSHYSQWIAIISAKGTCHIFILSPFGGDPSILAQNVYNDGQALLPGLALPWWFSSSFMINQQYSPPPPPVTLSVVSRIKNGNSGWLSTVSNAAASATGKISVPSGAIAAAFHNSLPHSSQSSPMKSSSLEHLLVYSPSGHLIQHELFPSTALEPSDSISSIGPSPTVQMQEEEPRVKVEPIQWWYVCRRSDRPEREEYISGVTLGRQDAADVLLSTSDCQDSDRKYAIKLNHTIGDKGFTKHERPHWYLSNAEVQINSGRIPLWQKPEISFHAMSSARISERQYNQVNVCGEFEIEKVPTREVEIRRKDLLPVFDNFHSMKSGWVDNGFLGGRYPNGFSYATSQPVDQSKGEDATYTSRASSLGSVENSDAGSLRMGKSLLDLDQMDSFKPNGLPTANGNASGIGRIIANGTLSSDSSGITETSNASSGRSTSSMNNLEEGHESHDPHDFGQYFKEGYCKVSEPDECREVTEAVTDADSSCSHCEREKPEDGENDDMLGGVFAFSEDGFKDKDQYNRKARPQKINVILYKIL
ncbi:hypothetical protein Scep_009189 [Stephania cephalantha]|uniref:BCAS3 domain-containing protein n=1 Tax=Stephania cephalantha TaxID=152367 RepID=A0AAP0PCB3_9MAGN